jgi:hypothetical protein
MTDSADAQLISLLEGCREEAAQIFVLRMCNPWGIYPEANVRWDAISNEITASVAAHCAFAAGGNLFFMGRQIGLWPGAQSRNLLERTINEGGQSAVEWLKRVHATQIADLDVITEVHGLIVREPILFSNGVSLLPPSHLIDTHQARALASQSAVDHIGLGIPRFPTAGRMTFRNVKPTNDGDHGQQDYLAAIDTIRRTVTALTLSEKLTPTTGVSWADFHNPDLITTNFGYLWQSATYDGRQADFPVDVTPEAVEWVEKFLALESPMVSKCDVALTRLNLARRRQTAGDKAIDGCIALEALLGDGQMGDLTYKLKLRIARLLGSTYATRTEISGAIGRFYSLRGKVVHGQSAGNSTKDSEVATRGLELTLGLLRNIVQNGALPNASELELGPSG